MFQKAGCGLLRQLSPADAESLIWALLCLYPDSLEVVREHVDTRVRKQREQVGRPLPPENPDGVQPVEPMTEILRFARWLEASEGERVRALEAWRTIEHLPRLRCVRMQRNPESRSRTTPRPVSPRSPAATAR
ncbi:MAG: hypothetical protein GY856_27035 [bacterium]|nr:hypothetical protein [bacterium]